jgi:hypothetical protein
MMWRSRGILAAVAGKRIAIIGSGPIGLEASLYARTLGHEVIVFERGEVGAQVMMWDFVRLFSPWNMNVTSLGRAAVNEAAGGDADLPLDACPSGKEFRERYLLPISRCPLLQGSVRERHAVVGVEAQNAGGHRITAQDPAGREYTQTVDVLLDCSGTYGNPRSAGEGDRAAPGEAKVKDRIFYAIPDVLGRDRARFVNRHTLLMGCGFASALLLRNLQELTREYPKTAVTWAVRRPDQPIYPILNDPLRTRQRVLESMLKLIQHPPGWLRFLTTAVLASITTDHSTYVATFRSNGALVSVITDEVVSLIGFRPDNAMYAPPGTAEPAQRDRLAAGNKTVTELLKNARPDFFVLGAKAYGTNNNFLLQAGHMQIGNAFRAIEDRDNLDLY